MSRRTALVWVGALFSCGAALSSGCALTTKADPVPVRYYAPPEPLSADGRERASTAGEEIRIGRVRAADHLRTSIVFQRSDVELGTYEADYWTERPTDYVERALRAELYDRRGFVESLSTMALTLDVDVLAFQEVRRGEARAARVTLAFTLHDRASVTDARRVTVEVPATSATLAGVVTAIGAALEKATSWIGDRVAGDLSSAPPSAKR